MYGSYGNEEREGGTHKRDKHEYYYEITVCSAVASTFSYQSISYMRLVITASQQERVFSLACFGITIHLIG